MINAGLQPLHWFLVNPIAFQHHSSALLGSLLALLTPLLPVWAVCKGVTHPSYQTDLVQHLPCFSGWDEALLGSTGGMSPTLLPATVRNALPKAPDVGPVAPLLCIKSSV